MAESTIVGVLTFLGGLFLGNRLALWRERRKEFNDVALRIRVALLARRDAPASGRGTSEYISAADFELLRHLMAFWKRAGFERRWSAYEHVCKQTTQDAAGQVSYENPKAVAAAIDRLVPYTDLR